MRWAVMGAGATGGYFGAMLARGGEEVAFIARGAHLAAMRERGLRVQQPGVARDAATFIVTDAAFSDDPAAIGPVDALLFAVKSYDTRTAAALCTPLVGPQTALIGIQNGIDNEDVLVERFASERVLGGSTRIEATITAPGEITRYSEPARFDFGPWHGAIGERERRLHETMRRCGIDSHLDGDVRRIKWEKFLFICPTAIVTSACRATVGELRPYPETFALYQEAIQEVARVGSADGVDLGGRAVEPVMELIAALPPSFKTSMQRDLERGRRIELDAFSGALIRAGRRLGVPTPVHETLHAVLAPMAGGRDIAALP